jgi:hypothetical protein
MITDYFDRDEIFCPEVYHKYGEFAWNFLDVRLSITLEAIRMRLNKAIYVNDYSVHGKFTQRGFRCVQCQLMTDVYKSGELFTDPHALGKAIDFDVQGMVASEVREYLLKNKNLWPYPFRLENSVSWCHLDLYNNNYNDKVIFFNK